MKKVLTSVLISCLTVTMGPTLRISTTVNAMAATQTATALHLSTVNHVNVSGAKSQFTLAPPSTLKASSASAMVTTSAKLAIIQRNVAALQKRIHQAALVKTHTVSAAPATTVTINGKAYPSISVGGDQTYVQWTALDAFHTPYAYEGNGVFAITGGMISGVVYKGVTYLPWNQLAPDVKATKLKNGTWNYTAVSVSHNYQIFVDSMNAPAVDPNNGINSPAPLLVAVLDGDNPVPNQAMTITLSGGGFFSNYQNKSQVEVTSSPMGLDVFGVNDKIQQTIQSTITWKDPLGKTHTASKNISFTEPMDASSPVIPGNTSLVSSIPVSIYDDQVLFNVTSGGYRELFQLDTGAQVPTINKQVATELHLPVISRTTVEGVTGQDQAYESQISFSLGGKTFDNVPCVVDPNYTGTSLLGYDFFTTNGYDILLSQSQGTLTLLTPSTSTSSSTGSNSSTTGSSTSSLGNGPSTSLTITPGSTSTSSSSSSTGLTVTTGSGTGTASSSTGSSSSTTSTPEATGSTTSESTQPPPSVTIPAPQKLWMGYEGNVGANPVIADTVAVAADADSNGAIYAYDLASGKKVWEYDQGNYYSGTLAGSPTTVLMTVGSSVLALSASTGQQMWTKSVGTLNDMKIIGNNAVIASPYNVYVVNAVTGQTIFSVATPWPVAKVTGDNNGLLLGTTDGKAIGFSWTGQVLQQTQLTNSLITGVTPDANGGWLVTQGTMVTDLSSSGTQLWSRNFYISIEGGNVSVDGQYAALATSDGKLYLLNTLNGSIYASNTMPMGASIYAPTASNGVIYEVNQMGSLSLFDEATLQQQQTQSTGGTLGPLVCVASPLVSSGTVVVQTHQSGYSGDAELVAFN